MNALKIVCMEKKCVQKRHKVERFKRENTKPTICGKRKNRQIGYERAENNGLCVLWQ